MAAYRHPKQEPLRSESKQGSVRSPSDIGFRIDALTRTEVLRHRGYPERRHRRPSAPGTDS
jgi:hypothetical protein